MKLIAAKDFYNSKSLGITIDPKDKLFRHANHVHKGARFSIGTSDNFKDLDAITQERVGTLLKYGCVVLVNQENESNGVIDTIEKEAKAEFEAHKQVLEPRQTMAELIAAAVATALAEAGVIKAKT